MTIDAVLATIVDDRQAIHKITQVAVDKAIVLLIHIKPHHSALGLPLPKRLPVFDCVDPLNLFCQRDVCGIVVLVVDSTFRTIPTIGIPWSRSFLSPPEPSWQLGCFKSQAYFWQKLKIKLQKS